MSGEHAVRTLCATLEVSRSAYYAWRKAAPGRREREEALRREISSIFAASGGTYGSPRVTREMCLKGERIGRNRVARLMREQKLQGRTKRRYRIRTTDSCHDRPIAPNHLAKAAPPVRPDQIWASDITYIETGEGWLYLAGVLDLCSRRLVGWAMSSSLETALPLAALQMALLHRQPARGLIHHSDRGVQYASDAYRSALAQHRAVASMSRKGNCYDNAAMESFWSTLKNELVHRRRFATRLEAQAAIFTYIEGFYNRRRLHSSLGYQSPLDYELSLN